MDKQWYVVNTYSGHENKVKEKLEMRAESMDMQDYIYRVVIPEEKVVEVKDGVTCIDHWGACILSDHVFLWMCMLRRGIAGLYGSSVFSF